MRFEIPKLNEELFLFAEERHSNLTKPKGSLGRLEDFAKRIVAQKNDPFPEIKKKAVFVFAGDHGVTEEGVSAYPKEVTYQMVYNFLRGGAAINVLSRFAGFDCIVVDVGVDYEFEKHEGLIVRKVMRGTKNFVRGPAMTKEQAETCIEIGRELAHRCAEDGYDLLVPGDMGIGNTTASSAVIAVLTGRPVGEVVGRGTGIDDEGLKRKINAIERGLEINRPYANDPIDVLSKVGGTEIGAIAGFILGAAEKRITIVLDGLISCAGALIAYKIEPKVKDFLFAGHRSEEKGQWACLSELGIEPILDLGMRLGEGTGGVLASLLIEASLKIYREMATFDEASVSKKLE
ncbi:MAG: nicotinate-nucleotide--dimethylbenzimidazole phosphoribosyltransferase [Desulfobacterota bacterium]|nr:nicotinate-nucleotide--dimethylbenzimidazole phosphoribosyltransferase [Thermodesulfobacteriota bacterium]MDW8002841.1 nicotinate-nucleotide--dimethylbenzimidazole phosphoribosyltransferase [Deltaproteobacteria bacterium]